MSEPAREVSPAGPFAYREELVDDMKVGGYLGRSNHRIIEFSIIGKVRKGLAGLPPWAYGGQALFCLGACLAETLGR